MLSIEDVLRKLRRETTDDVPASPGLVTALVWSLGWWAIASWHPWGAETSTVDRLAVSLTAVQCASLEGLALTVWLGLRRLRPRTPAWIGRGILAIWPLLFCVDLWLHHLAGVRLFSVRFVELLQDVPAQIVGFASPGVGFSTIGLVAAWWIVFVVAWTAEAVVRRSFSGLFSRLRRWESSGATAGAVTCLSFWLAQPFALSRFPDRAESIREQSTRHPMTMLGWLSEYRAQSLVNNHAEIQQIAAELPAIADRRIGQLRMNVVSDQTPRQPDVLIIVGESLRPELLTSDVMPHSFALTRRGLWLRQHYAGGNASSLGMFSIVNGLEAVWFYKAGVRFAPAMNRLFRQAGYELGFFASTDDWSTFQMDAFLSGEQYDIFQSERFSGLDADRRAIAAADVYLDSDPTRPPRLAMLSLYATHAPFWCNEAASLDAPAAAASYPIPFPVSWRPRVWNRYRNAARTLDASIGRLIRKPGQPDGGDRPRIVVVTGDHGESFGDDGTIGHGTKLSTDQTRTLAVIAGPGIPREQFGGATAHFDFLPTLLSAAGITTSMPNQFDGRDLTRTTAPSPRTFSIAGYVGKEIAIVAEPVAELVAEPWALRCRFSLMDGRAEVVYPIGPNGQRRKANGSSRAGVFADWLGQLSR